MGAVVDASFIAAQLVSETHSPFVRAELIRLSDVGFSAPALINWEVGNILWRKVRRGGVAVNDMTNLLTTFQALDIALEKPDAGSLAATTHLAVAQDLTVYDASYLEMALRTGSVLASLDGPLVNVARRLGVQVCSVF